VLFSQFICFPIFFDFDTVLRILVLQSRFYEALDVLHQQTQPCLFYKYGPELITAVPLELVAALIKHEHLLRPVSLLATFYKCFGASGCHAQDKQQDKGEKQQSSSNPKLVSEDILISN
jgi:hypothetical protein